MVTAEVRTGRGERIAVGAVLAVAAVLWGWALGSRPLQPYYAAAVHSMSHSVSAFFFAGFDPAGVVTVDKPPLAFWTQTLGVAVSGFHPWEIALVQTVEGVAAVFVLHRVVRRWVFVDIGRAGAQRAAGDAVELTRRIGWEAKHCRPVPPVRIGPDVATAGVLFDCGAVPLRP